MIIDVHTHTFPDQLAPRAVAELAQRANLTPRTDGTNTGLLASMQRSGVDLSLLMPVATKPAQVRAINTNAAALNTAHTGLLSFGALHPDMEDWQEEIDQLVRDGVPGVKFHPDYQHFFVDDPHMFPLYHAMADAGRILLFHAGVDVGLPPPVHCPPARLARVLQEVPELTIVAAHMGGYAQWDDVERYLVGRNVYLDTAMSLSELGTERMAVIMRRHGVEKMLFGTDSPWDDQAAAIAGIRTLGLTADEECAVLGNNAARLLGLDVAVSCVN